MSKKRNFVPDEKMQESKASGQETLRFHEVTESEFVLDCLLDNQALAPGGRVRFRTDSARVMLRFTLDPKSLRQHPTQTYQGSCGFDLYQGDPGHERYYYTTRTTSLEGDFQLVIQHDSPGETFREFMLHLPLFARLTSLAIGLDAEANLTHPTPLPNGTPIVMAGGELAQGRSASRSGMSLGHQLARILQRPVITLPADQLPTDLGARRLIFVQGPQEPLPHKTTKTDRVFAWKELQTALGTDEDVCFTDGTHLNDLGLRRLAEALAQFLENDK